LSASALPKESFFIPFDHPITSEQLPQQFTYPFNFTPHPLSLLASEKLKLYLAQQQDWEHNFGLIDGQAGAVIGKMFGVLVVETIEKEVGFLAAFSGKLAGGYNHAGFVPPIFDSLTEGSFLNAGMQELTRINQQIKELETQPSAETIAKVAVLQEQRRSNSIDLQNQLFDQYHFRNQVGEEKSLRVIFRENANSKPPAGAGDCAAPKLLQYAFQQNMKPLALAEFWWGLSPKSAHWKHNHYYPACREKCEPILTHMLAGIATDEKPE